MNSILPLYIKESNKALQHVGTGVLIKFRGSLFILTAAHVIDEINEKDAYLCSPAGRNNVEKICGEFQSLKDPHEKIYYYDFAFIKLENNFSYKIMKIFSPIFEDDFYTTDSYNQYGKYKTLGYPLSKSKTLGSNAKTILYSYESHSVHLSKYEELECKPKYHLITSCNIKELVYKGFEVKNSPMAPIPRGVSGGGMFYLSKDGNEQLAAIFHTYKEKGGVFIGTNIGVYLNRILAKYPELKAF